MRTDARMIHADMLARMRGESSIIKFMTLGAEAIEYMQEELAHPDPLADAIRRLPLGAGQVTTYVPSQASAEAVRKLRAVISGSNVVGAQVYQAELEFVYRYLQQGGTRVLIMGSHPAKPSDWHVFKIPRRGGLREWAERLTCEGRVYFYATEASDLKRVRDVFEDVQATRTFGILASGLAGTGRCPSHLARTQLEEMVRHADHLLVGAYDSTGTLIWSRQK